MRRTLVAGLVLAVAAVLVVLVSSGLDLELESVALLGGALGAVVALVPDRTPLVRLGGFAGGFVAAWVGYVVRAALLPDTAGGRAVAVGLVVLLCVGITAASMDRFPLWTTLLGTAALTGAYEFTFAAAPPELASTSVSTATTLLFNVAVGFLAAALVAPRSQSARGPGAPHAVEPPRRVRRRRPARRLHDGEDPVTARLLSPLRVASLAALSVVAMSTATPAFAADDGVKVVNTETVQVYTSPTGHIQTRRVYEQLSLFGYGTVDLKNPVSTSHLRNLDGFGGFDVKNGEQVTRTPSPVRRSCARSATTGATCRLTSGFATSSTAGPWSRAMSSAEPARSTCSTPSRTSPPSRRRSRSTTARAAP